MRGLTRVMWTGLYFWGWVMFAIILLGIVGRIILSYAVGQLTTTMVRDMRTTSMLKVTGVLHASMSKSEISSLVNCLTSDAFVLMQFADSMLKMGVITPLMMVSSVLLILTTSPSLAWIVAVSVPFLFAVVVWYVAVRHVLFLRNNKRPSTISINLRVKS